MIASAPTPAPTIANGSHDCVITPELLARYDVAGPRYTSYPTADKFHADFGAAHYRQALLARARSAQATQPLSLYVHIPFCQQLCYYCGCNKIITRHPERAALYLEYLQREVAMHTTLLGAKVPVQQLHLGGGTPTFLDDEQLGSLMHTLRTHFDLLPQGEYSIEVDPRTVTAQRLAALKALGFNRLSFGVQDFDVQVQQAIHREQPAELVFALMDAARSLGFESLNMDLIYGLPLQNRQSFATTLAQVIQARPDRIALYGYAHLPERFKAQRRIADADLPSAPEKLHMLAQAMQVFTDAGYVYIGMDHFALPSDALAEAQRMGRLHRNFQGYSTLPDCDLLGLGVSAIGKIGNIYSQNHKMVENYYAAIDAQDFPVERGMTLSHDDEIRRAAIMSIMCQGILDYTQFGRDWDIICPEYFAAELQTLQTQANEGLVELHNHQLRVTPKGWFFVRGVAMVFDAHLKNKAATVRFSKII